MKAFCDPHFDDGILLETVSDHQWLGFAKARTATFNLPEKPWQILADSFASKRRILEASSIRLLFSSIADWPLRLAPEAIPGQLRKLKQLYVQAGFPVSALQ